MFEGLKKKIRHEIEERKEARKVYTDAQRIEKTRVTNIAEQKRIELKKQRMVSAKEKGTASEHRLEKLTEIAKKVKENPMLRMLAARAAQELKRQIVGRPTKRKKRRKSKKSRRR